MRSRDKIAPLEIVVAALPDEQIAHAVCGLRDRYCQSCEQDSSQRLVPQDLVWDYLDPQERLSLDVESNLGLTKTGCKIAGQMIVYDQGGMIRVDAELSQRPLYPFTLAHEIGHWVLHRTAVIRWLQMLRDNGDNSTEFLTLNRDLGNKRSSICSPVEWQANRFAVHLLMPSDLVIQEFRIRYGTVERRYCELVASPSFVKHYADPMEYARFMAHKGQSPSERPLTKAFATSVESMAIRLQELQLV